MTTEKHTTKLVVGDWSHDGHNMTDAVVVSANMEGKDLSSAFVMGLARLGIKSIRSGWCPYLPWCDAFDDTVIPADALQMLAQAGVETGDLVEESWVKDGKMHIIDSDSFAELWLRIAKLGNPELDYKIIDDQAAHLNIGGYGLFST